MWITGTGTKTVTINSPIGKFGFCGPKSNKHQISQFDGLNKIRVIHDDCDQIIIKLFDHKHQCYSLCGQTIVQTGQPVLDELVLDDDVFEDVYLEPDEPSPEVRHFNRVRNTIDNYEGHCI